MSLLSKFGRNGKARKGISPIIASVLVIAFTMSVAMIASPFFTQSVSNVQDSTDQQTQEVLEATDENIVIGQTSYDSDTEVFTVNIQNEASTSVSNLTITVYGESPEQAVFDGTLEPQEITQVEVENVTAQPDRVRLSANDFPYNREKEID